MFLEMVHDDNQGAAETKDDAVHENLSSIWCPLKSENFSQSCFPLPSHSVTVSES